MISFFQHPIISQEKAGADKEKKNASCNEGQVLASKNRHATKAAMISRP
jgi:hypothetical protein